MPKALHWHMLAMKVGNVVFLRTETLVDALAVFMAFWKQHGILEGLGTCGCLSGFQIVLGPTWLS